MEHNAAAASNQIVMGLGPTFRIATFMQWVLRHGGIAFTVNHIPFAPGAMVVEAPRPLQGEIRRLFGSRCGKEVEVKSCTILK